MKKMILTYFSFILAMAALITLRVYAEKLEPKQSVQPAVAEVPEEVVPVESVKTVYSAQEEEEPDELPTPIPDEREYLWHGDYEPVGEFHGMIPRIICWGDSLTVSLDNKSAFPDILRSLSGCEVINYGVESENTAMIAMREGGVRVNVKATVIPADAKLIPIFLRTENDGHVFFLDNGDGGVNPCSICGIEGNLQKLNGSYYFERSTKGERISVEEGTQFKTFAMQDASPDDILVIFAGTNDLPDTRSVRNIIDIEKKMIESAGCDKYIIIGLTYAGGIPEIDKVNEALENEFKEHFVDIRKYMLNYALNDLGITPTADDIADIKKGEIPSSLRKDYVHGNKHYHSVIGEQVYRRMMYLGYLPKQEGI